MAGSTYAQHVGSRQTPQSEPILGSDQVQNSAGGYSWGVNDWTQLDRFLIIGSESGSYYASPRKLTRENAEAAVRCLKEDGVRAVGRIAEISMSGRAPKNDAAIFALAMACSIDGAKQAAVKAIVDVCRTSTHLFDFLNCLKAFRSADGRSMRRAISAWYTQKSPDQLAYQLTKYRQRNGWTHHDVLHKCHAKPPTDIHSKMFGWTKTGDSTGLEGTDIAKYERLQASESPKRTAEIIREGRAVWEWLKTDHLNSPDVWDALLDTMPVMAMVRNLGKMSSIGLLRPMSDACQRVVSKLGDADEIQKSRIHPISVLFAMYTYCQGHGVKGKLSWIPDDSIVDALDGAFHSAFGNIEPTGKRHLIAVDVSGSMAWTNIANSFLTPRDASAAMAMVSVRTEALTHVIAFDQSVSTVALSPKTRLDDAVRAVSCLPARGTDCALPMLYAAKNKIEVDAFVVYTDNETWFGDIHPSQALQQYRDKMGIPSKLIVSGMVANNFTIADPKDGGMLDVVGFDASVPQIMSEFVGGGNAS